MTEARSGAWAGTLLSNALIVVCGVLSGTLTARLLQPEGRGMLAFIIFWPQMFAMVGLLSLNEALTLNLSKDADRASRALATAITLAVMLATVTIGFAYWAIIFLLPDKQIDVVIAAQRYMLIFVPMHFLAMLLLAVDHGRLEFRSYNATRLLPGALFLLALVALWFFNLFTVENCAWANLLAIAGTTVVIAFRQRAWLIPLRIGRESFVLLQSGIRIHAHALLSILTTQADRAIVLALFEPRLSGIYVVAWLLPSTVSSFLTSTVHTVTMPFSVRVIDVASRREFLRLSIQRAVLASAVAFGLLALCVPWGISILFGDEYSSAVAPALILCFAAAVSVVRQALLSTLRGWESIQPAIQSEGASLAMFMFIGVVAYQSFGLLAIACALLVGQLSGTVLIARYMNQRFNISIAEWNGFNLESIKAFGHALKRLLPSR